MAKFCKCETPVPNFDGTCKDCSRVLTWEWSTKFRETKPVEMVDSDEEEESPLPNIKPVQKTLTLSDQIKMGDEAAKRTIRYASLFETIGKVMQILNVVGVVILFFIGFFIPDPVWLKFAYWASVLIIWAFSYVQTSLIRGLASYFQMKASDHLIKNWKK
jgi:hypothetical protein